jgi:hypothetical protein
MIRRGNKSGSTTLSASIMRDKPGRLWSPLTSRVTQCSTFAFLLAMACAPRNTPQLQTAPASANEFARHDTLSRPVEIYNDAGSELGAIRAVITTPREFDRLWQILRRDKSEVAPSVDFTRDMVIIAGIGAQSGAGNRIRISSVRDTANLLGITVEFSNPTAECEAGYPATDHPTAMVRVPQSRSTPVFRDIVHRNC